MRPQGRIKEKTDQIPTRFERTRASTGAERGPCKRANSGDQGRRASARGCPGEQRARGLEEELWALKPKGSRQLPQRVRWRQRRRTVVHGAIRALHAHRTGILLARLVRLVAGLPHHETHTGGRADFHEPVRRLSKDGLRERWQQRRKHERDGHDPCKTSEMQPLGNHAPDCRHPSRRREEFPTGTN